MNNSPYIHETAVVDQGAHLGAGVKVWHFCHIMAGARLGTGSSLGQNTFIASGVTIGSNCKIQNNVSLYSGVTLGDNVFLGPSCVFTNVINPRSSVNRRDAYAPTTVENGVTIGANATILCGITIGTHAFIGAGAVLTSSVLPYSIMVGNPARRSGWMSPHGSKLIFVDGIATCTESSEVFGIDSNEKIIQTS